MVPPAGAACRVRGAVIAGVLVSLLLATASVVLAARSGRIRRTAGTAGDEVPRSGIRDAPLVLDLMAAMLSAGSPVEAALSVVAGSCEPRIGAVLTRVHAARLLGASWTAAWEAGSVGIGTVEVSGRLVRASPAGRRAGQVLADIRQGLRFATATGAPSAALLHAHAAQLRRRHNREAERKAAALGVRLVLPLGLCSLPAFICLGVVPVVLGLLPAF